MKAKSTLVLALAAGAVSPAFAGNEPVLSNGNGDVLPIAGVKHVYINLATGERVVSDFIVRASVTPVWDNSLSDGFFHGLDNPNRSTATPSAAPPFGAEIVNWGDLRPPVAPTPATRSSTATTSPTPRAWAVPAVT